MPLLEDLKDQLKSDSADLKHTGDRWGGSISAALFLREFIGNVPNWVHCDIAGPAMGDRIRGWDPKGGTGHGVLTFLSLVDRASRMAAAAPSAPSLAKAGPAPAAVEEAASASVKTAARKTKKASAKRSAQPAGTKGGTKKSTVEGPRTAKAAEAPAGDVGARQPQGRKTAARKRR